MLLQYVPSIFTFSRMQLIRSESPETLYTMTTQQQQPQEAAVIDTR